MTRKDIIKCAVKDCENHSNEGQFVGLLCLPCHRFIAGDGGLYSQAFRNSSDMIKQAVEAEREACAKLADKCIEDSQGVTPETEQEANYLQAMRILSEEFAIAIRARGEK
jgi:hypothetical protein